MTLLNQGLETFDYGMPYWVHIYNKNIDELNSRLLKINEFLSVRKRYQQDGMILVYDNRRPSPTKWTAKYFRKRMGSGIACTQDDDFTGSDGNPPNVNKWLVNGGTPTIQGNRLRLRRSGGVNDGLQTKWKFGQNVNFDVMLFYDVRNAPTIDSWRLEFGYRVAPTYYFFFGPEYDGSNRIYARWREGGSEVVTTDPRTKGRGWLRINCIAGQVSGWYKDGPTDPQWRFIFGQRENVGTTGTGNIWLQVITADSNPPLEVFVDHFRVPNGCTNISTTTTTTTT